MFYIVYDNEGKIIDVTTSEPDSGDYITTSIDINTYGGSSNVKVVNGQLEISLAGYKYEKKNLVESSFNQNPELYPQEYFSRYNGLFMVCALADFELNPTAPFNIVLEAPNYKNVVHSYSDKEEAVNVAKKCLAWVNKNLSWYTNAIKAIEDAVTVEELNQIITSHPELTI